MDFSHYIDAQMVANISMGLVPEAELGEEDLADTVLSFVQNLGYVMNDYTSRSTLYPVEALALGGVCDDLSVLYASMMISIGFRVVLIWYPHIEDLGGSNVTHLNVGVHLTSRPEHAPRVWSVSHDGLDYYIAETTSDHWLVGDLPEKLQGQETYVEEAPAPTSTLVITKTATTSTLVLTTTRTLTSTSTRFDYEALMLGQATIPLLGYLITIVATGVVAYQLEKRRNRPA
jgi:hypothetical protein